MSDLAKLTAYTIPYSATGAFSQLVNHYVANHNQLTPFFQHSVSLDGLQQAIVNRKAFSTDRNNLVKALQLQYKDINLNEKQSANLSLLLNSNTFTITTAHQPNIFTGPLYFIYKILHTIKLTDYAKNQLPQYNFVPVYYMGSEDADLEELGHTYVDGKKYEWQTKQTGAVGRMKVDNALLQLIEEMAGQIGIHPFGNSFIYLLKQAYTKGRTIQEATLHLVNSLFAEFGLLIVVPDNQLLKSLFAKTIQKELFEQFSSKAVMPTIEKLSEHYKVQAAGRDINLFYLSDGARDRIEKKGDGFAIQRLNRHFSKEEIVTELANHPEAFSPNVILR
ncbi:MAG: bacillithiol biosynthesis protein BshC, partial [Chitinophagaceae bacterium]